MSAVPDAAVTAAAQAAGDTSPRNTTACTRIAIVGETTYPCHHHEHPGTAEIHVFAADLPSPCMAPFCRLPAGHYGLHDIPSGRATYIDRIAVPAGRDADGGGT